MNTRNSAFSLREKEFHLKCSNPGRQSRMNAMLIKAGERVNEKESMVHTDNT
jgi:hypothetical protein